MGSRYRAQWRSPAFHFAWNFVLGGDDDEYFRDLEATDQAEELEGHPFFPGGQMPGSRSGDPAATVNRHAIGMAVGSRPLLAWFKEAEEKAGIAHVPGRRWPLARGRG